MKALLLFIALCVTSALSNVLAVNLTLGWDPSPDAQVTGYKLYYGVVGFAKQTMNVGNTTEATISGLIEGQPYEFYVTAYDATGAESDPSNQILYTIPVSTAMFRLSIDGFSDGYVSVSPRGSGLAGNLYAAGSSVTLTALAKTGAVFTGWDIAGIRYPSSQITIPIGADTRVTPVFKNYNGSNSTSSGGGISMSIGKLNAQPVLNIGGESGAWVLESSTNLTSWQRVATGLTSERLPISMSSGNGFYRVRTLAPSEL